MNSNNSSSSSSSIQHIKGKYIKSLLTAIETQQPLTQALRKIVLDHMNDFVREITAEPIKEQVNESKEENTYQSARV